MHSPLVLDFDASLPGLKDALRIDLGAWQERIRFGCSIQIWRELEAHLAKVLPSDYGTVCMGSGDYHHISHLLIKRLAGHEPFDVVVCDNHPDNMRFPFGIHCGSWVKHISKLPQVRSIHVMGITSGDVGWQHAWENHLWPLYNGKVRYWTIGVGNGWAKAIGLGRAVNRFADRQTMLAALNEELARHTTPVYLSIDKDVLSPDEVRTNWDQGCLTLVDLQSLISTLQGRIIGSDITGEVSIYHYLARWKRLLSAMDEQPEISTNELQQWQARQAEANGILISSITQASAAA